jgi:hypothetical protein
MDLVRLSGGLLVNNKNIKKKKKRSIEITFFISMEEKIPA